MGRWEVPHNGHWECRFQLLLVESVRLLINVGVEGPSFLNLKPATVPVVGGGEAPSERFDNGDPISLRLFRNSLVPEAKATQFLEGRPSPKQPRPKASVLPSDAVRIRLNAG